LPVLQAAHPALAKAPAPRLATIRQLAQRWGLRDGTLRTALSRACATGTLKVAQSRYRLGPVSFEQAAAARMLLEPVRGYVLAVVLEGERVALPALHALLERLGFRPLQRSVWVGTRTRDDRLSAALNREKLGGVIVFLCDEVDAQTAKRLAGLWGLRRRAETLRQFHRQLFGYLEAPGLGTREAAWRCVEAAPIWYRLAVLEEPPFPMDLRGPDYPLDRLNDDWRAHLKAVTPALLELWNAEEGR